MSGYVLRRCMHGLLVVFLVVSLAFFMVRLTGDPVTLIAGPEATPEQISQIRTALELDYPLPVQYLSFLGKVVQGDFGRSFFQSQPAMAMVLQRLPATVLLTGIAFTIAVFVGVPLGVFSSVRPNSFVDWTSRLIATSGQAVPVFALGLMLIYLFSVKLRLLPYGGFGTWRHLVLPGVTLSVLVLPVVTRVLRSTLLNVLRMDYIRTGRAKGVRESQILFRHALRNAAIPVVTVLGLRLGFVIGGAVVTEQIFSFPGLGRLAVQAVIYRDFPVIQAVLVVISTMVVLCNLCLDVMYVWLDPRIKYN